MVQSKQNDMRIGLFNDKFSIYLFINKPFVTATTGNIEILIVWSIKSSNLEFFKIKEEELHQNKLIYQKI